MERCLTPFKEDAFRSGDLNAGVLHATQCKLMVQTASTTDRIGDKDRVAAEAQKIHRCLQDADVGFDTAKNPLISNRHRVGFRWR